MRMNMARAIVSPSLNAQEFTLYRTTGRFSGGRWVSDPVVLIPMTGIIAVVSGKELQQMPEADRVKSALYFFSPSVMFVTREGATSDKILWRGDYYRIFQVGEWVDYGFYKATAERITGN